MRSHQKEFIEMILAKQVLRFGDFTLKSGRTSPYFFNAGLINDGGALARIGAGYAQAIIDAGICVRHALRPGLQGHPARDRDRGRLRRAAPPQCADRVQPQGGEGAWRGRQPRRRAARGPRADRRRRHDRGHRRARDDRPDQAAGAAPAGVVLALDRQERGQGPQSAVQEIQSTFGIPVIRIITLDHLIEYMEAGGDSDELESLKNHRRTYCVEGES